MEAKDFGQTLKRCNCDFTMCEGMKCAEDTTYTCSYLYDTKLAQMAIKAASTLAHKAIDAEMNRRPLGSEHIEAAKKILEIEKLLK